MSTCASQPKTMYITDVVIPSLLGGRAGASAVLGTLSTCALAIYTVALVMLSLLHTVLYIVS